MRAVQQNGRVFTDKLLPRGQNGKRKAPGEAYVAQVVKTDANGQFTWTLPWSGWWGFAALTEDDQKMQKDGQDKAVEVGGVIWIYAHPVK